MTPHYSRNSDNSEGYSSEKKERIRLWFDSKTCFFLFFVLQKLRTDLHSVECTIFYCCLTLNFYNAIYSGRQFHKQMWMREREFECFLLNKKSRNKTLLNGQWSLFNAPVHSWMVSVFSASDKLYNGGSPADSYKLSESER